MPHPSGLPVPVTSEADGLYRTVKFSGLGDGLTVWSIHRSIERVTNGSGSACSHNEAVKNWTSEDAECFKSMQVMRQHADWCRNSCAAIDPNRCGISLLQIVTNDSCSGELLAACTSRLDDPAR